MGRYDAELRAMLEAAREAGDVLRREFHRVGGPRGEGGHAEADEPAERLIRARLEAAFPAYGYVGEETRPRRAASDPERHVWSVDPNDGTSAYLRGWRGPSVSIGLLRAGLPVTGVVFAYAAPDDDGDLFWWAEGMPAVMRNGRAVEPGPRTDTVLVTQGADAKPEANASALGHVRFRGVPGIAYRLALVAAGEAAAGVMMGSPHTWDLAGGHALLRGAGLALQDQLGREWRYDEEGLLRGAGNCFLGPAETCERLRHISWKRVLEAPKRATALIAPRRGASVADAALLARAQGCWLGQLAGDALGSLVEFQRDPGEVRELRDGGSWNTLAGQPTDDSEMALALARSLVAAGGYDPKAAEAAYVAWFRSGPFDVGSTTRQGLTGKPNPSSQANGALMRCSPIGIAAAGDPARAAAWARADARITHPHEACVEASAAFVAAIAVGVGGAGEPEMYERALAETRHPDVSEWLRAAAAGPPEDCYTNMGWVRLALHNAFYQLLHAPSLEQGVIATVARGGDTDTNAAIAGALLGARHGRGAVPFQWRDRVLTCRPIAGAPGVKQPRPDAYWPVDALILAEHLLLSGRS